MCSGHHKFLRVVGTGVHIRISVVVVVVVALETAWPRTGLDVGGIIDSRTVRVLVHVYGLRMHHQHQ